MTARWSNDLRRRNIERKGMFFMSVEENVKLVRDRIDAAAREAGRDPGEVTLVAATKVLNLESTNKDVARRLLDFLSGVAYANEGKIKKVAISTYIITPFNVDILGDLIDELENNGLYF